MQSTFRKKHRLGAQHKFLSIKADKCGVEYPHIPLPLALTVPYLSYHPASFNMRAIVAQEDKTVKVEDKPIPKIKPNEILYVLWTILVVIPNELLCAG
jgi:hypothetical protein